MSFYDWCDGTERAPGATSGRATTGRSNVITNRDCGYTDFSGQVRSRDRWIDDQLTSSG